jgi:hypothetical protein
MVPLLTWISALSFLGYGTSCVITGHMRAEFERFGLARQRVLVGLLQLAGAIGLLVGFHFPLIGILAAGGLALQMLLGVGVRVKIRDSFQETLPALFYFFLNAYLCFALLRDWL